MNRCVLSFIIPALNEEEHIGGVLDAIVDNIRGKLLYEVIVVDNGSSDRTVEISEKRGAVCLKVPGCPISTLRNMGETEAKSNILVFLDADVYLGKGWGEQIGPVIEKLCDQTNIITGSLYGISEGNNWIERIWFAPRTTQKEVKYINGGHLILHRSFFTKMHGFDPELETGEDYEFCARAKAMGAIIENNPDLKVIHAGYPKSIRRFFGRERWHGRGDNRSIKAILSSKPATLSLVNFFWAIACTAGAATHSGIWVVFLSMYIFYLTAISLASSVNRSGCKINRDMLATIFLYMVYFTARTFSLVDVLISFIFRKYNAT